MSNKLQYMAIGIGLHCWHCGRDGACDLTCLKEFKSKEQIRDEKIKKILTKSASPEETQAMEDFLRRYLSIKK